MYSAELTDLLSRVFVMLLSREMLILATNHMKAMRNNPSVLIAHK